MKTERNAEQMLREMRCDLIQGLVWVTQLEHDDKTADDKMDVVEELKSSLRSSICIADKYEQWLETVLDAEDDEDDKEEDDEGNEFEPWLINTSDEGNEGRVAEEEEHRRAFYNDVI